MYLLKVESKNPAEEGFKYFTIEENFDLLNYGSRRIIENKPSTTIVYGIEESEELAIGEEEGFYAIEKGWKCISFFKNNELIDILFNGKAYLIKDNSKTIEMF